MKNKHTQKHARTKSLFSTRNFHNRLIRLEPAIIFNETANHDNKKLPYNSLSICISKRIGKGSNSKRMANGCQQGV